MSSSLHKAYKKVPLFLREPNPEIYMTGKYTVVDFETTNLDKGSALNKDNRLILACWKTSDRPKRSIRGGEYDMGDLVKDIESSDFIIAHNAKFELQWLQRCGLDTSNILVYDTMLGDYVIGGNRWTMKDLSLDTCCKRWNIGTKSGIIVSTMIKEGRICPSEIPKSWLLRYCYRDIALTEHLYLKQSKYMAQNGLLPIQYSRCLVTPVLADIEKNGMCLDNEVVLKALEEKEREFNEKHLRLQTMCPKGYTTNSTPQLQYLLYEHFGIKERKDLYGRPMLTPKGQPKTDIETIKKLKPSTKKQKKFLELYLEVNDLRQELTKYLRKFGACCEENTGILQAVLNQVNTHTHRLSSTGLRYRTQLQNIPRDYKRFFTARHRGWSVGEADEAQLEFRVAGHLSRDPIILESLIKGEDIHAYTADIITEAGQKTCRDNAKPHTFKPLYGGTSGTEAERAYYKAFKEKYKATTDWQNANINSVLSEGFLVTESGLVFYWPYTTREPSGYVTNSSSICNYPVQSFATAEIVPLGLVWLWHFVHIMQLRMLLINTIHDSIIAEIPNKEEGIFCTLSKVCLLDLVYKSIKDLYGISLTVPLECEVSYGSHWGNKENKVKYTVEEKLWKP